MTDLRDRIAVVTGASRGVGRGIAHELGAAGATVYVTGRSVQGEPTADGLPGTVAGTAELVSEAGGRGIAVLCDHTDDAQVEALFARVEEEEGRLDVLVNAAWGGYERYDAVPFDAPFWEQPAWRWRGMFRAGLRAAFMTSKLAAPLLIRTAEDGRPGLIAHLSFGDRGRWLGQVPYDTAKTAVDRLAFGMARELRQHDVAAVALYPGFVRTERVMSAFEGGGADPDAEGGPDQSPRYTGRAVVALAADPDVLRHSGAAIPVGDLAEEYGFTDIDGRRPPAFRLPDEYA